MEFCLQQANPGQVDGEGHGGGSCFPHWEGGGSRDCRHGVFRSFGTGCGILGIAWAGLHDDVPEKGARLDCFPLFLPAADQRFHASRVLVAGGSFFQVYSVGEMAVRSSGARSMPAFSNPFPPFFLPGGAKFPWIWECPCAAGC